MLRISTNMPLIDNRFRMAKLDSRMDQTFRGISSSRAIINLRDAPVNAAHTTRLDSLGKRAAQYMDNADTMKDRLSHAEVFMGEAVSIVQRVRELAVRGSNGTQNKEDTFNIALEVDALLEELVVAMNAKDGQNNYIFAGDAITTEPFRVQSGRVPDLGTGVITDVSYVGDINRSSVEIADGQSVDLHLQGNKVFWAEPQQIFGAGDTNGFTVTETNRFLLDNKPIQLEPGDNIQTVLRKINDSGASVKASLDPVTGSLNLTSTVPHQIWLEPVEGTALVDLGLLRETGNGDPPQNWHPDAFVSGANLIDQIISLRDALITGDQKRIGGSILGGLDMGLNNLLQNIAELGSNTERLEIASKRLLDETGVLGDWKSRISDLDVTEAITAMSMMEYTRKAAYQVAGRILQTTLMDFLR